MVFECAFKNIIYINYLFFEIPYIMEDIKLQNNDEPNRTKAYFSCGEKLIKNSQKDQGFLFYFFALLFFVTLCP